MQPSLHSDLLDNVRHYQMPKRAIQLLNQYPPIMLLSVTAGGKDAVMDHLEQTTDLRHVITHTTRPPRPGEINGQDYWFVSEEEMLELLNAQAMIEAKDIHGIQVSGTSIKAYEAVLQAGHKPLLSIDVQGAEDILSRGVDVRPFFILPPNFDEWMRRLEGRGRMSHVEKLKRLESAKHELTQALRNDKFILIVNNTVQATAEAVLHGISDAPTQFHNRELVQRLIDHIGSY